MNPNQALWEKGDFTRIAETMRDSGDALARSLGITPGLVVLDVGCGDGTTAIPEAMLGAQVQGVDISRNLVDAGNRRAEAMGLNPDVWFGNVEVSAARTISREPVVYVRNILKYYTAYNLFQAAGGGSSAAARGG